MKARIYDPATCRFLSPDPYISDPEYATAYNKYAYCLNNPLSYVDPSGEFVWVLVIIGAWIGGMQGLSNTISRNPHANGWQMFGGWFKGAVVGAIGGAFGGAGAGIVSVWGNVAYRAAAGAFTGGLNAAVYGCDIGKGMLTGGAVGGFMGFVRGMQIRESETVFRKGCKNMGINPKDAIPLSDRNYAFLNKAQNEWIPNAPIDKVDNFITDNIPLTDQQFMDNEDIAGMTKAKLRGGVYTGRSNVYINKNIAFNSARELYYTMSHEFVHVSQFAAMKGFLSIKKIDFIYNGQRIYLQDDFMEYYAYDYQNNLGVLEHGMNSFSNDLVVAMKKQWPMYSRIFDYNNYSWTKNVNFKYPF